MSRAPALLLLATCAIAGCRDVAVGNDQNGQGIHMANEYHDNLMKLSPGNQRIAMRRAIHDEGRYRSWCKDVVNAGYQEEYQNMRMWVAQCTPEDRSFAIFLAPNGDVQVRNCADAEQLQLPACKALPPPVADPTMPRLEKGASDEAYRQHPATPETPTKR